MKKNIKPFIRQAFKNFSLGETGPWGIPQITSWRATLSKMID